MKTCLPSPAALLAVAGLALTLQSAHAAPTDPQTIPFGGSTQTDGWANLNASNFPGYPGFGATTAWPSPIGSNTAGSGDATLNKTAGAAGPLSTSIYSGGFSVTPNTFGATFAVSDSTPVSGIQTVSFQLNIGQALGYTFFNNVAPVLSFTTGAGTTTGVAATFASTLVHFDTGTTFDPGDGSGPQPVYQDLLGYQWDLSGISGTISNVTVSFSDVQHAQIYGLQLDQSSQAYSAQVVPEPSTYALIFLGAGVLFWRLRRNPVLG